MKTCIGLFKLYVHLKVMKKLKSSQDLIMIVLIKEFIACGGFTSLEVQNYAQKFSVAQFTTDIGYE